MKQPTINLKKATLQRIYEFALRHMRKQGKPSMSPETMTCLYRGPDGTKCVAGAMFSDEDMKKLNIEEGTSLDQSSTLEAVSKAYGERKANLLRRLQECHDIPAHDDKDRYMANVETLFKAAANDFGLTYKPPGAILRA
jgi:hypothetical protein